MRSKKYLASLIGRAWGLTPAWIRRVAVEMGIGERIPVGKGSRYLIFFSDANVKALGKKLDCDPEKVFQESTKVESLCA